MKKAARAFARGYPWDLLDSKPFMPAAGLIFAYRGQDQGLGSSNHGPEEQFQADEEHRLTQLVAGGEKPPIAKR